MSSIAMIIPKKIEPYCHYTEERYFSEDSAMSRMTRKMVRFQKIVIIACILLLSSVSLSRATQYEYDRLHRLIRVTYDNGMQITYTYDEVGNRIQRISTLAADITIDGIVDFQDFAKLAARWLDEDCIEPNWCEQADIDWSTEVDFTDLVVLAENWLRSPW